MSFSIHFVDRRKKLARIEAGSLQEFFEVHGEWSTKALEKEWQRQLSSLFGRKKNLALPISGTPDVVTHAWIAYRVGRRAHIQERYFFRGFHPRKNRVRTRKTRNEEGRKVSEWSVPLSAIARFLKKEPNRPADPPRGRAP